MGPRSKKVRQSTNRRGRALAADEVVRIGQAVIDVRAEQVGEEGAPLLAREVRDVAWPHLAVAEPVGGDRELDRDERRVTPAVEPTPATQDVLDEVLADDRGQELMHDDPLVMPAHEPLGTVKDAVGVGHALGRDRLYDFVVELQQREVQLRDDQVLIVSRVADQCGVLAVARQVTRRGGVDEQLGRAGLAWSYRCGLAARPEP